MPRYLDWDYTTGEVVEYAREGECNGCGACCMALIRFTSHAGRGDAKLGATGTDEKGVWHELREDDGVRRFYRTDAIEVNATRCKMLDANKRCAVHVEKDKVCASFPLSPI